MDNVAELLLQIQFVLLPVLLLQQPAFANIIQERRRVGQAIVTVVYGASMLLCVSFPVTGIIDGHIFDLRFIPIVLAVFYGGFVPGSILLLLFVVARWFAGGSPWPAIIVSASLLTASLLLLNTYVRASYKRKIAIALGLVGFASSFRIAAHLTLYGVEVIRAQALFHFIYFPLLHFVTMFLAVFVIESFLEKRRLAQTIIGAERISMIGQLSAAIAHEVRNPMTSVRGFLQLLRSEQLPQSKRLEYIGIAMEEIVRADQIIHEYLSLAKPQPTKIANIPAYDQVRAATLTLSSYALLNNVSLELREGDRTLTVRGDPAKLSQVLVNLLKNGIEATVGVEGERKVTADIYKKHGMVCFEIRDTGRGMGKETAARIGTAFHTDKENGTGLGLMICFQMISEMNGTISVASEPDRGTTFTVYLPAAALIETS
ncbi:sensor histidine kinase [Paenibacillus sp. TRM 82003]|nr:sensor histidine kinase [Paenibacillus sp. TRM 82003]